MTETVITQADREAAVSIEWVQTTIDDHQLISEAFAKHRISARNEALAEAAKVADANISDWDYTAENIAASIRALANNQQQEAG